MLALQHPRAVQWRILFRYIRDNAGTEFGRRHEFDRIKNVAEYQARVPLSDYEDYVPCVERIASGESHVLTRAPVRCFVPTSGSTNAEKLIPYTDELRREFNRGIGPWIFDLYLHDPRLMGGRAYWSISPVAQRERHHGAVAVGFEEDSAYVGGFAKRLVETALAVPGYVRQIRDIESFRYVTLRHLLRCPDLRLISVWHPSFLTLLIDALEPNWHRLLRELDHPRVAQLQRIGPHDLCRIWPNLRLISCWADAAAALAVPALRKLFPSVTIQGKGLLATEGFVTLPLGRHTPVAVRSHFFEFLDEAGNALLADELTLGGTYSVVLTTAGGLYRYRLLDRVVVDGFLGRTPSMRFIGKEGSISDICGEKITEGFAADVLRSLCDRLEIDARFVMLAPHCEQVPASYVFFIEAATLPGRLADLLDDALCANPHYRYCRMLGQLAAASVFNVREDGYGAYARRLSASGQRLGNIKPCALSALTDWHRVFHGQFVGSTPRMRHQTVASL